MDLHEPYIIKYAQFAELYIFAVITVAHSREIKS